MLDPGTFVCERCGECCIRYIVKLSKADIERIKKEGYGEEDFVDIDSHLPEPTKSVLRKREDDSCIFLVKNKGGISSCKVYDSRPSVCIKYPFLKKNVETCKPITFSKQ